ncbi:MAG TPA: hypothetical protein PLK89_15800, partial [Acidobacteriota bacterium]|nr:hypothetical protein [Acidobacteriota bacterium]
MHHAATPAAVWPIIPDSPGMGEALRIFPNGLLIIFSLINGQFGLLVIDYCLYLIGYLESSRFLLL